MSDIVVDTYKLTQYAQRVSAVNSRIKSLDYRLDSLYRHAGLVDLLNLIMADVLTGYSWRLERCQVYLQGTASDFELAEQQLMKQDPTNFNPLVGYVWYDGMRKLGPTDRNPRDILIPNLWPALLPGVLYGITESAILLHENGFWKAFWDGDLSVSDSGTVSMVASEDGESYAKFLTGKHSTSVTPGYGSYKDKNILGDSDHLNINRKQDIVEDFGKQINKDEKWYKPKATILEGKVEDKIEGSVLEGQLSGGNDWAEGSVYGKVLTGEAHAGASVGLYVYTKDKDGNTQKLFSPGVSAEVGASVSALEVGADGRIGLGEDKNMLGLYGDANAELLTAEAKAKVALNSKEIYAGASAEADLAKVSATGGVSVLGTDVGVNGSLKVGVGAHAEVGYTDGKLKVDIGAAVGVGFDLGFEVDVSGTVDAVSDAVTSAWDWMFG